jgi:hypothetical protein
MGKVKHITQTDRVLEYIKENGGITLQAFTELGCTRLSAQIYILRHQGIFVDDKEVCVKNRYGEKCYVKYYFIPKEKETIK